MAVLPFIVQEASSLLPIGLGDNTALAIAEHDVIYGPGLIPPERVAVIGFRRELERRISANVPVARYGPHRGGAWRKAKLLATAPKSRGFIVDVRHCHSLADENRMRGVGA